MSKKCINCGAELEDEAVFCDECGTRQMVSQTPDETQVQFAKESVPSSAPHQEAKKMKNSGLGIASLIVGIVSLCTFGLFVIPEILGLIFGSIAMKDKDSKHELALVGIVTSGISIILAVIVYYISFTA